MKKVLIAATLIMAFGTATITAASYNFQTSEQTVSTPDYQTIEIKDLPQAVQDAISANYPEYTVTAAAVEEKEDSKTYQVTLTDKEGMETTAVFNENGEEIK